MGSVSLTGIRKSFGHVEVLRDIEVEVADGEFVVLVGPSGCGKSTLLRAVAGLENVSGGDIVINDVQVNDLPPKRRNIAMVFQNYALYPHMTVAENMGFALRLAGTDSGTRQAKVAKAAEVLGLESLLDRYPRQLSGGQRQRVAMGRALVRDPQVFLFDEPLSNLDAKLRVQMRAEIKELHQRLKTTIIYVTHDQIEAMTMADKIVVMRDGRIEQTGSPLELYDRPANSFVAGFIGSPSMNFVPGVLEAGGNVRVNDAISLSAPETSHAAGTKVMAGIRPEDFIIDDRGVPARVVLVEPTGAETQILINLGGHSATITTRERVAVQSGSEIRVLPERTKMHLFDADTGKFLRGADGVYQ